MKNLYFFIVLLLLSFYKSNGQSDVIIWLDNSGSIDTQEWSDMTTSVNLVIHDVLDCNPENRVAIVHYGGSFGSPRIYIEDPNSDGAFTNNEVEATNFIRRSGNVGFSDFAHEALSLIGNALDGITNPFIVSPQTQLNSNPTQNLVLYFFNDALRDIVTGSALVNILNTTFNSDAAFINYTNFKNNRNAYFVVTSVDSNINAQNANAAISSFSNTGNYNATIENYPAEPDNNQLPRMYLNLTNFIINPIDLGIITSDICFIGNDCPITITLLSPTDDVLLGSQDNRQAEQTIFASNLINTNSGAIYHAGDFVELNPGFTANFGSRFTAYIEGCTDSFVFRNQKLKGDKTLSRLNVVPNPSNNLIEIILNDYKFNSISVSSIIGKNIFNKTIESNNSYRIDISNYPKGIYLISVTSEDGQVFNKKIIKN